MKRKILLSILVVLTLFIITGCGSSNGSNSSNNSSSKKVSNTFKIKDISLVFDQDSEFHDFKYKNAKGIEPDESKQAVLLDYINKELYDGRFAFRVGLMFTSETTLKEFLAKYQTTKVTINGINWDRIKVNNKTDNKDTTSVIYSTEKNGTVYVVTSLVFNEANVDVEELSSIFINGVTIK